MRVLLKHAVWFAGWMIVATIAAAQQTPTPTIPTLQKCRLFCSGVFDTKTKEYQECSDGCDEAEVCKNRCDEKFSADKGKHRICFRSCMAKSKQFEPPPTPDLPKL